MTSLERAQGALEDQRISPEVCRVWETGIREDWQYVRKHALAFAKPGRNPPTDVTPAWKFASEDRACGIRAWSRTRVVSGHALPSVVAVGRIRADPDSLCTLIKDLSRRMEWEPGISRMTFICPVCPDVDCLYSEIQSYLGGLISARDFVTLIGTSKFDDGSIVVAGRSVKHPRVPPREGYVRGHSTNSGYCLRPTVRVDADGEKHAGDLWTDFTFCGSAEIGGNIPHFIVNRGMVSNAMQTVRNLQRLGPTLAAK